MLFEKILMADSTTELSVIFSAFGSTSVTIPQEFCKAGNIVIAYQFDYQGDSYLALLSGIERGGNSTYQNYAMGTTYFTSDRTSDFTVGDTTNNGNESYNNIFACVITPSTGYEFIGLNSDGSVNLTDPLTLDIYNSSNRHSLFFSAGCGTGILTFTPPTDYDVEYVSADSKLKAFIGVHNDESNLPLTQSIAVTGSFESCGCITLVEEKIEVIPNSELNGNNTITIPSTATVGALGVIVYSCYNADTNTGIPSGWIRAAYANYYDYSAIYVKKLTSTDLGATVSLPYRAASPTSTVSIFTEITDIPAFNSISVSDAQSLTSTTTGSISTTLDNSSNVLHLGANCTMIYGKEYRLSLIDNADKKIRTAQGFVEFGYSKDTITTSKIKVKTFSNSHICKLTLT